MNEAPTEHAPYPGEFGKQLAAQHHYFVQQSNASRLSVFPESFYSFSGDGTRVVYGDEVRTRARSPLQTTSVRLPPLRNTQLPSPPLASPMEPAVKLPGAPSPDFEESGSISRREQHTMFSPTAQYVYAYSEFSATPSSTFGAPARVHKGFQTPDMQSAPLTPQSPDALPDTPATPVTPSVPTTFSAANTPAQQMPSSRTGFHVFRAKQYAVDVAKLDSEPKWLQHLRSLFYAGNPEFEHRRQSMAGFVELISRAPVLPTREEVNRFIHERTLQQSRQLYSTISRGIASIPLLPDGTYRCNMCASHNKFTTRKQLYKHYPVHLAVKPFSCIFCGSKFSRKDSMFRHTPLCRVLSACLEVEFGDYLWKSIRRNTLAVQAVADK